MKRHALVIVLALVVLGGGLAACRPDGFPDQDTTGPDPKITLTAYTGGSCFTAGQVIENVIITGEIDASAANCTFRNDKFVGNGGLYGVKTTPGGNAIIENSEFSGDYQVSAIYESNWSCNNCDIYNMTDGDGVKFGSNTSLTNSWLHDFPAAANGAHLDGGQVSIPVSNVLIRHNAIFPDIGHSGHGDANSAVLVACDICSGGDGAGPITIDNNWLGGGNYTIFALGGPHNIAGVSITNNQFVYGSAQYGPVYVTMPGAVVSGNTYFDKLPDGSPGPHDGASI